MRESVSKLVPYIVPMFLPFVTLAAFALIAFGVSLLCLPAGWIVGGGLLLLAVIDARR